MESYNGFGMLGGHGYNRPGLFPGGRVITRFWGELQLLPEPSYNLCWGSGGLPPPAEKSVPDRLRQPDLVDQIGSGASGSEAQGGSSCLTTLLLSRIRLFPNRVREKTQRDFCDFGLQNSLLVSSSLCYHRTSCCRIFRPSLSMSLYHQNTPNSFVGSPAVSTTTSNFQAPSNPGTGGNFFFWVLLLSAWLFSIFPNNI